jgi:hypothetical protein
MMPFPALPLQFAAPEMLWTLAGLPILWWVLRLLPPEAVRRRFPSLRLWQNLPPVRPQTAFTPLWVLILRGLILCLICIAFAQPQWDQTTAPLDDSDQPVMILMDNCTPARPHFPALQTAARNGLSDLSPTQNVAVLALCPASGSPVISGGLLSPAAAGDVIAALKPQATDAPDTANVVSAMQQLDLAPVAAVQFYSSGAVMNGANLTALWQEFKAYDDANIYLPPDAALPVQIWPEPDAAGLMVKVTRLQTSHPQSIRITAEDAKGRVLNYLDTKLAVGEASQLVTLSVPPAASEDMAIIRSDAAAPARVAWPQPAMPRRVGIVSTASGAPPLLRGESFLRAAMPNKTEVIMGSWRELLGQNLRVILSPSASLPSAEREAIQRWMMQGGTLVRFAEKDLPPSGQLLPGKVVELRRSARGANAWITADASGPAGSRFYLRWLLDNQNLPPASIMARYADGSALWVRRAEGMGQNILFTTAPLPEWNDWVLMPDFARTLQSVIAQKPETPTGAPALRALRAEAQEQKIGMNDWPTRTPPVPLGHHLLALALWLWLVDQMVVLIRNYGLWGRK